MVIQHCLRCNEDWCYYGDGRALRCGKCKSPYWDMDRIRPKREENVDGHIGIRRSRGVTSGAVERGGNVSTVPILSKAKGAAKRLHPVLEVRDKLDERGGHIERPSVESAHHGHVTFQDGDRRYCSTCQNHF